MVWMDSSRLSCSATSLSHRTPSLGQARPEAERAGLVRPRAGRSGRPSALNLWRPSAKHSGQGTRAKVLMDLGQDTQAGVWDQVTWDRCMDPY